MSRLVIISNRLPVNVTKQDGKFGYRDSVGGVATGISSLTDHGEKIWFGWPGIPAEALTEREKKEASETLSQKGCYPVFLSTSQIDNFYSGFCNRTIWPLFHYFSELSIYDESFWQAYKSSNQLFCDELIKHVSEDDFIWVHDYQLMLLPEMIREKLPEAQIGFFLHIPFPSFEIMRELPRRSELLNGILGADLIGFHEYDYVRHFLSSVYRICGCEHNLSKLQIDNRQIRVDAFPMGIDYEKYASIPAKFKNKPVEEEKPRIILSVDRLDYTKGIPNRLEAYESFLSKYPEYHGKVRLVMIAVPTRTEVEEYASLRETIEKDVGRINGKYSTVDWTPISYMFRSLPFEELSEFYYRGDVGLITPLRDGMNLVAKEFIAAQKNKEHQAVLILSEMAGAASELSESIVINPHHKDQIVEAIKTALDMPQEERAKRNKMMQGRISRYTVGRWATEFIVSLKEIKKEQGRLRTKYFTRQHQQKAVQEYNKAEKRLIMLDYDGTLAPFSRLPEDAMPCKDIIETLKGLCANEKNTVVVISGRDKDTLSNWLGKLPLNLVAEHGAFYKSAGGDWESAVNAENNWKEMIKPILELTVDRTPGSLIEEKSSSLVWHFRKSEPDLAKLRTQELKDTLMMMAANLNIGVFEGNKIVEVKPVSVNKGQAAGYWIAKEDWAFIFCAGDDCTDEDMFEAMPEGAVSCKIGKGISAAKYKLNKPQQLREFLKNLK
ncbi:bifunctional alpha,alpha-trehalose-phosphate synthase (UDP-forming)/trehalose-phosphatase [Sedimentisphaera salicampi]|uniref:Trehalose-phosphate synthase n=1 Tax=Sedimentisphaera salicampi TaxID=1941349 RepID=A0A1W6LLN9_9BACT|nr:bifunctional alpha,alpha-trehalose-phosphate synthase (UDP-forming)/trehalose-phosphatase [Sedimentisphaera salicampi]ARN56708.1 Trehalose-phosphate synthase [Sedimentisphaera salicampi]OXU15148.1 Trehalose-phosphate synthase [Sedimentisphaera salicampi]